PRWVPVSMAFIISAHERTPWSMRDECREQGKRECEKRAAEYGLPPLRWPSGWPRDSYSLPALRAAYVADASACLRVHSRGLRAQLPRWKRSRHGGRPPRRLGDGWPRFGPCPRRGSPAGGQGEVEAGDREGDPRRGVRRPHRARRQGALLGRRLPGRGG